MRNDLKQLLWGWLAVIWSSSAWAAQSTFAEDLSAIPLAAVQWTVILSLIGGLAFTMQKIANPAIALRSVWIEMIKDMSFSVLAGLLTFFICSWLGLPYYLQAAAITLAGYGGSRVVEKYLMRGMSEIDRLGNRNEGGTP